MPVQARVEAQNLQDRRAEVPRREDADGRGADVGADGQPAEEQPGRDELLVRGARGLGHDVRVGRVEAERGGRRPVGDEVDPEQLHGDEALGEAERGGEEDGRDLSHVGRDHVAVSFFVVLEACKKREERRGKKVGREKKKEEVGIKKRAESKTVERRKVLE